MGVYILIQCSVDFWMQLMGTQPFFWKKCVQILL